MRRFALMVLALFSVASAQSTMPAVPPVHVDTLLGDVWGTEDTVTLIDRAGAIVWSVKLSGLAISGITSDGKRVVVGYQNVSDGVTARAGIIALEGRSGKVLWRTKNELPWKEIGLVDWLIIKDRIIVDYIDVEPGRDKKQAPTAVVYDLKSGSELVKVNGWVWKRDRIRDAVFLNHYESLFSPDPGTLSVLVVTPDSNKVKNVRVQIPPRKGCGSLSKESSDYLNEVDGSYLSGVRRDACGFFVARVKWDELTVGKPEIFPLK